MSNVIQFLEAMGKNPAAAQLSTEDYAANVAGLDLDATQRQALMERDHDALSRLLGGRRNMRCLIATPETTN